MEALQLFNLAERAGYDPDDCSAGRWTCHMLLGQFERGWQESDAITSRGAPDPQRFWDGTDITGRKILIRCLHGLGDTIQFIRYAPLLRERARAVAIEAQPALKLLLQQSHLADKVITWGEPEPVWDRQIEVTELPRIFRTTLDNIPARVPYLTSSTSNPSHTTAPLKVGLNWASSTYNRNRSIRLESLQPVLRSSGVSFFSVQAGSERAQLSKVSCAVTDVYDESGCVLAAAENLARMDLVISVDTMVAHLAGAIGKPVWVLLPYESDWRWMLARSDSPWYPTMRLFRQPRPGAWKPVVELVAAELTKLVRENATTLILPRVLAPEPIQAK
jgi:hypothetical protein